MRGKRYLEYPQKYYAEDVGLRNARLNFRETEVAHLMENVIFQKIIVEKGYRKPMQDGDGVWRVGVIPFLLEEDLLSRMW